MSVETKLDAPQVLPVGEGRRIDFAADFGVIKAESPTAVCEWTMQPDGFSPPPHHHDEISETLYVLEGEAAMTLGEETRRVGPGGSMHVPAGTIHTIANAGAAPLRLLMVMYPGRVALRMVEELAGAFGAGEPDQEKVAEVLGRIDFHPAR